MSEERVPEEEATMNSRQEASAQENETGVKTEIKPETPAEETKPEAPSDQTESEISASQTKAEAPASQAKAETPSDQVKQETSASQIKPGTAAADSGEAAGNAGENRAAETMKKAGSSVKNFFASAKAKLSSAGKGGKTPPQVKEDEGPEAVSQASPGERSSRVIRTSLIGILANILLAVFKALVGAFSHSIAIMLDAVNNLSDAMSSIITICGTRLSGKKADKKHPFGYGRVEYLTTIIIAVIILYAGISSLTESVKKIFNPGTPKYGFAAMLVLAVAVAVKIYLGRYVKKVGEEVNSESLQASGTDALMDAAVSGSVFAAAIIYLVSGVNIEAWIGLLISVLIIRSGLGQLRESLSEILGKRADSKLSSQIKGTIASFPEVNGAYDLVLHDYGPDSYTGSVHIEVADTMTADRIDALTRRIVSKVYCEYNVILTGVGIYSINTKDTEAAAIRDDIRATAMKAQYVKQTHGFYLDRENKVIRFDMVVSFSAPKREAVFHEVLGQIKAKYPEYRIVATMDTDFTD